MTISFEPHFEVRLRADQHSWEIMVTWGHALRHVVEGACFQVRTYTPSVDRTAVIALDGSAESRPAKAGSSEDPQARGETAESSRSICSPRIFHRTCAILAEEWNLTTLTDCYMP